MRRKKDRSNGITALYERLSRDDDNAGESNSIVHQKQKGWERIRNDNEPDNSMDGFQEIPTEEMEQLGLPEEWLKQK